MQFQINLISPDGAREPLGKQHGTNDDQAAARFAVRYGLGETLTPVLVAKRGAERDNPWSGDWGVYTISGGRATRIEGAEWPARAPGRAKCTTYSVQVSAVGWTQWDAIDHAHIVEESAEHRTLAAAVRCDRRVQDECRRTNGSNTYFPTRILARDPDGTHRHLTEAESGAIDEIMRLADTA